MISLLSESKYQWFLVIFQLQHDVKVCQGKA